jgi:hypothetical protein
LVKRRWWMNTANLDLDLDIIQNIFWDICNTKVEPFDLNTLSIEDQMTVENYVYNLGSEVYIHRGSENTILDIRYYLAHSLKHFTFIDNSNNIHVMVPLNDQHNIHDKENLMVFNITKKMLDDKVGTIFAKDFKCN